MEPPILGSSPTSVVMKLYTDYISLSLKNDAVLLTEGGGRESFPTNKGAWILQILYILILFSFCLNLTLE